MEEAESSHYVDQLKAEFDSCDTTSTGFLDRDELTALCRKLQLDAHLPLLLDTLLGQQTYGRVNFEEFKDGFVAVLSRSLDFSTSEDDSSYLEPVVPEEVKPKFVKGSKRYGRRSRPDAEPDPVTCDSEDSPPSRNRATDSSPSGVRRAKLRRSTSLESVESLKSDEEVGGHTDNSQTDFQSKGSQQEEVQLAIVGGGVLAAVCEHMGLPQLSAQELDVLLKKLDADLDGRVSLREFQKVLCGSAPISCSTPVRTANQQRAPQRTQLDECSVRSTSPSLLTATVGQRVLSRLDDGSGCTTPDQVIALWTEEGIRNSRDILQTLDFSLEERLSLADLTLALDNELLVGGNGIHQAALISYKNEIQHLQMVSEQACRERDKVKADLDLADQRNLKLVREVDDRHASMETLNQSRIRDLEQDFRDRLTALRSQSEQESEALLQQLDGERSGLKDELRLLKTQEAELQEELGTATQENRRLEEELSVVKMKLTESESSVNKLQKDLDQLLHDKFGGLDPSGASLTHEERFSEIVTEYEQQCRELRDRNDELSSELELMKSQKNERTARRCTGTEPEPGLDWTEQHDDNTEFDSDDSELKRSSSPQIRRKPMDKPGLSSLDEVSGPTVSIQTELALEQLKQKHQQELQQLNVQLETQVNYYERSLDLMRQSMEVERKDISQAFKLEISELEDQKVQMEQQVKQLKEALDKLQSQPRGGGSGGEQERRMQRERAEMEQNFAREIGNLVQRLSAEKDQLEAELKLKMDQEVMVVRAEAEQQLAVMKLQNAEGQRCLLQQLHQERHLQAGISQSEVMEAELGASKGQCLELEAELRASRGRCLDLEAELGASRGRCLELETELGASRGRCSEMEAELGDFRRQCSELGVELGDFRRQCSELGAELGDSRRRCLEQEAELGALRGRCLDLEAELGASRGQCLDLEAELGASRGRCSELEVELGASRGRCSELEVELGASRGRCSELEAELGASRGLCSELEVELEASRGRCSELEARLEEACSQLEESISFLESHEVLNRHLEEELQQLSSRKEEEAESHTQKLEQVVAEVDSLKTDRARLIQDLKEQAMAVDTLQVELDGAVEELNQRRSAHEVLQEVLTQEQTRSQQLQTRLDQEQEEAVRLSQENNSYTRLADQLSTQIVEMEEEISTLRDQIRDLSSQLNDTADLVLELRTQLNSRTSEVERAMLDSQNQLRAAEVDFEQEKQRLTEQLVDMEQLVLALEVVMDPASPHRTQLEEVRSENAALQERLTVLQQEVQNLEDDMAKKRRKLEEMERERDRSREEEERLHKENSRCREEVLDLSSRNLQLSNDNAELSTRLRGDQESVRMLRERLAQVSKEQEEEGATMRQLQDAAVQQEREKVRQQTVWTQEKQLLEREISSYKGKVGRLSELEAELSSMTLKQQWLEDDKVKLMRDAEDKLNKVEQLQHKMQTVEEEAELLRSQLHLANEETRCQGQEVSDLQKKLQDAHNKVEELESSTRKLIREKEELHQAFQDQEEQNSITLQEETHRLMVQNQELNQKLSQMQVQSLEVHKLNQEQQNLKTKLSELETARTQAQDQALRADTALSVAQAQQIRHRHELQEHSGLREQVELLQVKLKEEQRRSQQLEETLKRQSQQSSSQISIKQEQYEKAMSGLQQRTEELETKLKAVRMVLQEKVQELKDQMAKNTKSSMMLKDLYVENSQLMKALQVTEQRQKTAEKKNFTLEEKIHALNKLLREIVPASLAT
ncbi:ninein-like protein isoform X2 [Sphaeramia orbicularis]|uniref:ninein-like protein isoform X2 n=1 Tax=Sphaeramia orbicularis TaxID=375764 RepID=UPI001180623D|nr:ninein-like protein isoform X2 [Sphaeramia orbicularis]